MKRLEEVVEIIRLLSRGYNPVKHRPFSKTSSMKNSKIRDALEKAYEALRYIQESEIKFNAGKPWRRQEIEGGIPIRYSIKEISDDAW